MEKVLKTVKRIAVTLMIIAISIIAFIGVYSKQNNIWQNKIPEFNYGIELDGLRELRYVLDTTEEEKKFYIDAEGNVLGEVKEEETESEGISLDASEEAKEEAKESDENKPNYATEVRKVKANEDAVKTKENFEKSKNIIQKRLENQDVYEYNMRLDTLTGELIVEVPDDENLSIAHSAVTTKGKFEIIDDQTGIVLIDRADIKEVRAGMYQADTGYQVCLEITFNKEGTEELKKVSNKYREVVDDAGESTTYYIAVNLDGETLTKTYFGEELSNGVLQLPLGQVSTDSETINGTIQEVRRIADVINNEELPIAYALNSDNFIQSQITEKHIQIVYIIFTIALLIVSVILVIKFKLKGLIAAILGIGYIAILNIIVRYTGIYITINSVIAFVCMVILNYLFIKIFLLEDAKNEEIKESFVATLKKYYLAIIPVFIIAIVFTFISNVIISSIGMILFWGLLVQAIYNAITIFTLRLI